MQPKCIAQVAAAAGRALTNAEIKGIDDRMDSTMRNLARQDPQGWMAKSKDTQVMEAAQAAMADMKAEAARKVANAQRQVLKTLETQQRIADLKTNMKSDQRRAVVEDLNNTHLYNDAIKKQYASGLMDLVDAASSTQGTTTGRKMLQFLFDAENPQMTKDLVSEIFANGKGGTGNAVAQAGAKAWLQTIEAMRTRFNDAGGDVGKLEYGYMPQPHDSARIRQAGPDAWAQATLDLLDRKQYVNADGIRMNDAQVIDMLRAAHETLASDGMNKQTPGQFKGPGAKANSGSKSRVLHFKDGQAYLDYNAKYGMGSMYDAMISHVGGMARNIGLVERMGPNPNQQFRLQLDLAERADGPITTAAGALKNGAVGPQAVWDVISGNSGAPASARLAEIGQHTRNVQTMGKLAGAVISSITDLSTMMVTTGYNKLPYWDLLTNTMTAGGKDAKEFANMHGMIAESLISDLNRWQGENIANTWSGRLANSTMKLSLMNAWTDTMRRGFSLTMMAGMGKLSGKKWSALTEWDRSHLARKGITEADWKVVNAAQLTDYRGQQMLTPEAIAAADIAQARPQDLQRISDSIAAQTAELSARNAADQQWIRGRITKFDDARNAMNRRVKDLLATKLAKNEKATEPLLQRMVLLEMQRDFAKLQADLETDFNKLATHDEVRAFLNAVEDGASADKTSVGPAKKAIKSALGQAETSGRNYGVKKGKLQRQMVEIENKITAMDRSAHSEANQAGKEAQAKAQEMGAELADYIKRSQERQQSRAAVIQRIQAEEAPRLAAESQRIKNEVTAKILGFITDESEFAVMNPDITTRAIQTWGGQQAGTGLGEFARMTMQFKSFPIAMISRHWRRIMESKSSMDGAPAMANKAAYTAALAVSGTILGAIAFQTKQVVQGKDPIDMTTPKFWTRAIAQGGGAGFMGDIVLGDTTQDRSPLDSLSRLTMGPSFGSLADAWELTKGNFDEWNAGKDTHAGAEALRFAKGHLPYVSLWYSKAALDHLLLHSLQENLSPGYLDRQRSKAQKDWQQGYWWTPGETAPDRAPDVSAIGGN